jgi:hypothetical protein
VVEDEVMIHILGNAVGALGAQARILGLRASAMGPIRMHELCHVKCSGDVNFVRVFGRHGAPCGQDHAEGPRVDSQKT